MTPVVEVVGWTMLSGKETEPLGGGVFVVNDVTGDTIVNAKAGGGGSGSARGATCTSATDTP